MEKSQVRPLRSHGLPRSSGRHAQIRVSGLSPLAVTVLFSFVTLLTVLSIWLELRRLPQILLVLVRRTIN